MEEIAVYREMSLLNFAPLQGSGRRDVKNETNQTVAMFFQHYEAGKEALTQGVDIDSKYDDSYVSKKIEACELYKKGLDSYKKALALNMVDMPESRRQEVKLTRDKIVNNHKSCSERFVQLMTKIGGPRVPDARPSSSAGAARTASPRGRNSVKGGTIPVTPQVGRVSAVVPSKSMLLRGVDAKFGERLLDEMLDGTGISLDDVAGCESAKRALEEAVILPALNPSLFSGLRQPVKGILLFGPPGNGKTMLAKAVANESKQVFFNLSAASLTSKWVGDGEKTIRCLFQIARNAQPSIIFIDEIDSILCDRSDKDSETARRMKTEFLVQFDGATSSADDRVLVIGATNRPFDLDDAVLRRFPKRIMLGLPDDSGRCTLIKSTLMKHNMAAGLTDSNIRYIASRTSGYSNSDLVSLCKEAAMVPVRCIDRSKLASTDTSKIRNLKVDDFDQALQVIKPSTNPKNMDDLMSFTTRAGAS